MALSITNVSITPNAVNVGEPVTVKVTVSDITWESINIKFTDWDDVKTTLPNWLSVQNYH